MTRRLALRARLTLAFAAAAAVILAVACTAVYLDVKAGLDGSLDASLRGRASALAELATRPTETDLRRALAVEGEPAQVLDSSGRVVVASPGAAGRTLISRTRLRAARRHEVGFERRETARLLARPAGDRVVLVSTSMVQREKTLERLGGILLFGAPLLLLIASGAGYLVAAGALRPVERMRRRASEISAATPDARLPLPPAHDELRRLGETLNAMLTRLEAAARHERAFLANASHELRTPLAILKAEVDVALTTGADERALRAALRSIGEEADRLGRLAEDLLVIARGDDDGLPLSREPLDLGELAALVARRFATVTDGAVHSEVPAGLVVNADPLRLEQALGNLVDNALRHGKPPIVLRSAEHDGVVEVHVLDAGPGFDAAAAGARIPDASGRAGGFGLGLAIVASIARAHGGELRVTRTADGADVVLVLDASSSARLSADDGRSATR